MSKGSIFLKKHSSTILTTIGAIGVVGTSVLAVKATPKALDILQEATEEKGDKLTKTEVILNVGPVYIPAFLMGAATIGCIFGANVLNKKQQAALTSAYVLLDNSYKEYRKTVGDIFGEEADTQVMTAIAKNKYDGHIPREDYKLYYDEWSDRYFEVPEEKMQNAEYLLNRNLALQGYASLNEFYFFLGQPPTEVGEILGWSESFLHEMHGYTWIDFEHTVVPFADGLECRMIGMDYRPSPDYMCY